MDSCKLFPEEIKKIAVISPASRVKDAELKEAISQICAMGIEVMCGAHLNAVGPESYLAGTAEERAADFMDCWMDPAVDLILCARGGYGSAQILPLLDWSKLCNRHPILVGYSDITALHLAMLKHGAGIPVAGFMAGKISNAVDGTPDGQSAAKWFYHALKCTKRRECVGALTPINGIINAHGLPVVANLTVLMTLLGTPYFPDLTGKLLIIEDVDERLYKIDRYLTQLDACGILGILGGLIFADFRNDGMPLEGIERLARRFAPKVTGGVWTGFRFGHMYPAVAVNQTRELVIRDLACEL